MNHLGFILLSRSYHATILLTKIMEHELIFNCIASKEAKVVRVILCDLNTYSQNITFWVFFPFHFVLKWEFLGYFWTVRRKSKCNNRHPWYVSSNIFPNLPFPDVWIFRQSGRKKGLMSSLVECRLS